MQYFQILPTQPPAPATDNTTYIKQNTMGNFSFFLVDTDKPIICDWNGDRNETVYLLAPGRKWREDHYEGYGVFGGKDAYQLLAELNRPEECNGDVDHDRDIGIYLPDQEYLKYPLRITSDPDAKYEDYVGYSRDDPNQGCCPYEGSDYD